MKGECDGAVGSDKTVSTKLHQPVYDQTGAGNYEGSFSTIDINALRLYFYADNPGNGCANNINDNIASCLLKIIVL